MAKLALNDLVNFENSTAIGLLNDNNTRLETALENTLSRDGTNPNQMGCDLDMNSHRIYNLVAPATATEPLRLQDLADFIGGGLVITTPNNLLTKSTVTGTNRTYLTSDAKKILYRSNSGSPMVDTLPTGGSTLSAQTEFVVYNADTSLLAIKTSGTAKLDDESDGIIYLGTGQAVTLYSDGTNYITRGKPWKIKLGANTTIYVSQASSITGYTGLTIGTPLRYLNDAYAFAMKCNTNGHVLTFQLASETFSVGLAAKGRVAGIIDCSSIVFKGDETTPANVTIRDSGSTSISATTGAMFTVTGVEIRSFFQHGVVAVDAGSTITMGNVRYGPCAVSHLYASNFGTILIRHDYAIIGNADSHISAVVFGYIDGEGGFTCTITNVPAITTFVDCRYTGFVDHKNGIFSGAIVGQRFIAHSQGSIHTQTNDTNYFPGTIAGDATGGYYD